MDTSAGVAIAGAIGAVIGAMITYLWRFSERQQQTVNEPTPVVPPGAELVLSVLSSSAVLIDSSDTVVQASAPAFAMGIINDDRLEPAELMSLVRQVRRDGQVREADISLQPRRGTTAHIHARVAPLTSRLILVLADDRTREQRVESIRRDFVANVSHELKTPVGALNLLAEAVGEAKDDPDAVVRFSSRMHLESERLTRLVQQIIDLSRLQNDVLSDEATTVKVGELVSEACEHSATDAEHKDIDIVASVEPDLFVHGDRAQLHAAVSNLVENAVTYSPEGSRVTVSAQRDGQDVRLTVTDNGIGIPGEELDRIFERFYRVDPARARATGGTGLGLSIVKHVAASNGGSVEVWSEPGLGSSFTLVLPAHHHDIEDTEEEQA
ncbi:sensor histidine kinase [Aeromicrobium chenweiae]|uniref:Sensor-like histidine kinase SenX3 n=1 Tax=Aeromicrobium chenweiae TaxID=2079793 RepID=A0A2S0WIR8_9ACTN|nr:ATP-binding protein [Aeromicrobium chenweiae]AWB91236.1 two-component sensor histidine kinase [Aeromicrobium chenweiae]TGN31754.1 two-component sensor histidine kinase [Aeromicrobium chenweiae]